MIKYYFKNILMNYTIILNKFNIHVENFLCNTKNK